MLLGPCSFQRLKYNMLISSAVRRSKASAPKPAALPVVGHGNGHGGLDKANVSSAAAVLRVASHMVSKKFFGMAVKKWPGKHRAKLCKLGSSLMLGVWNGKGKLGEKLSLAWGRPPLMQC